MALARGLLARAVSGKSLQDALLRTSSSCNTADDRRALQGGGAAVQQYSGAAAAHDGLTTFVAASPFEQLMLYYGPTQMGVQVLETIHTVTGLPWWASIPLTAIAARAALLPLTIKAKAASASIPLMNDAFTQARLLGAQIDAGHEQAVADAAAAAAVAAPVRTPEDSGLEGAAAASGSEQPGASPRSSSRDAAADGRERGQGVASSSSNSSTSSAPVQEVGKAELGRIALTRRIFRTLRKQQHVPTLAWYIAGGGAQVAVFVSMTSALSEMSRALWPGLTDQGALYFSDLTVPALYMQTLSTPLGTAGAILPLASVLLYLTCVDNSAAAKSPNMYVALRIMAVPFYVLSLIQPHAVLLYWLTHLSAQLATQQALTAAGAAGRLRLPPMLTERPTTGGDTGAPSQLDMSRNPGFFVSLAESLPPSKRLGCYYAALKVDGRNATALRGAAVTHALCGHWEKAVKLSLSCAEATTDPEKHAWALKHAAEASVRAARVA